MTLAVFLFLLFGTDLFSWRYQKLFPISFQGSKQVEFEEGLGGGRGAGGAHKPVTLKSKYVEIFCTDSTENNVEYINDSQRTDTIVRLLIISVSNNGHFSWLKRSHNTSFNHTIKAFTFDLIL